MILLDQSTRSQISDLSEACGRYWELRGIAQEHREEMQLELEHHLLQAAMDAKSPETVLGPNPATYGMPHQSPPKRKSKIEEINE